MRTLTLTDWSFRIRDLELPCKVPNSMYRILLDAGIIGDPFRRDNEKQLTEWSEQDCCFETVLTPDPELLACGRLLLRFDGIDTVADILLNGELLGHTENMHRTWTYDVKGLLHAGENRLSVRIFSPLRYIRERQRRHMLPGNAESVDGVAQIRKASYMMGWDWGPVLPDMGIWRPVTLLAFDTARLDTAFFRQVHADGKVFLHCRAETDGSAEGLEVRYALQSPAGENFPAVTVQSGREAILEVESPALWWPNGYGEHPLYLMTVTLLANGVELDEKTYFLGLRTLTVSTEADRFGNEFCFVVNGKKIFSMGANYVPQDNLLSRITPERTEKLLRQCADANFNTVRVWGGGFYPDDSFYDACDRLGLIVWQDFMIACNSIWLTDAREADFMAEFRDNLLRIRHHACLGLLNGNNEVEGSMANGKPPRNTPLLVADYLRLYHRLLPELCQGLVPDCFYWPSSPSSCQYFDGKPHDETRGDSHYWEVWHNWKPYEEYRRHFFRFCSEFGFEALPEPETVERFTEPCDRNLFSPVMLAHQKCRMGNGKIMSYLSEYYLYPQTFMGVLYGSQILQADAIRTAVEHFRRNRGRCMGAIYWQLNDCWSTVSWSSVDSEGRRKALHYAAKQFYAPILLSAHEDGARVTFNLSNETLQAFSGSMQIRIRTQAFADVLQQTVPVAADALSAVDVGSFDFTEIVAGQEADTFLEFRLSDSEGTVLSASVLLFVKPKCFHYRRPTYRLSAVRLSECLYRLRLQSNTFAHKVRVDFPGCGADPEEQYLNLTGPEGVTYLLRTDTDLPAGELQRRAAFFSVYDLAPECMGDSPAKRGILFRS